MKACDTVKELVTEDAFERRFAYKNLIIVTTVFFLIFTSFNSIQNLQTSINKDPDLGFLSLTVLYLSFTIPCFFLPNLLIQVNSFHTQHLNIYFPLLQDLPLPSPLHPMATRNIQSSDRHLMNQLFGKIM